VTESSGYIGVALDGTLAHYDGWKGPEHVGDPVPEMLSRVRRWLSEGFEVRIFTARVSPQPDHAHVLARAAIDQWVMTHIGKPLAVTCQRDVGMVELWDDRCVQVVTNRGQRVDGCGG